MKGFLYSTLIRSLTVLVMLAGAIAIPLTGSITHTHAASASSQASWSIVSSPNPGAPTSNSNGLNAVTTYSSTDAWTVGNYHGSTNDQSLIEHWNGKSWTQQTSPNPGTLGSYLNGVKALSATDGWAVGYYTYPDPTNPNNTLYHSLIVHTTDGGNTWTEDTTGEANEEILTAIDGDLSSGDAWAVGYGGIGSGGTTALTLHLENGHFSEQPNVSPNSNMALSSVSELSNSDVWAVGSRSVNNGSSLSSTPFTMHWESVNGTYQWVEKASPTPGSYHNGLSAVTDIGPNNAWAVGTYDTLSTETGYLIHWDGTSWSTTWLTVTVGVDSELATIAADSTGDIWAGGVYSNSSTSRPYYSLIWHSTDGGTTWQQEISESDPNYNVNDLRSIAIGSNASNTWAVGQSYEPLTGSVYSQPLIEQSTAPIITVSPTSGMPGSVVTVTGSRWAPADVVDIFFSPLNSSSTPRVKATVTSNGTFQTSFTVPSHAAFASPHSVLAEDETTYDRATAPFVVTCASIGTVSPTCYTNVYAGYAATSTPVLTQGTISVTYSDVKGSWKVPALTCPQNIAVPENSFAAFWVGLGGINTPLEQIGISAQCDYLILPSSGVTYTPVWEMIGNTGTPSDQPITQGCSDSSFTTCIAVNTVKVAAGDTIVAEVKYQSTAKKYLLKIDDKTQQWHTGGNGTPLPLQSVPGSDTIAARSSAECIAEDPPLISQSNNKTGMADFGRIPFTNCVANGKSIGNSGPLTVKFVMVQLIDGTIKAQPSSLNTTRNAFSVTWLNPGP